MRSLFSLKLAVTRERSLSTQAGSGRALCGVAEEDAAMGASEERRAERRGEASLRECSESGGEAQAGETGGRGSAQSGSKRSPSASSSPRQPRAPPLSTSTPALPGELHPLFRPRVTRADPSCPLALLSLPSSSSPSSSSHLASHRPAPALHPRETLPRPHQPLSPRALLPRFLLAPTTPTRYHALDVLVRRASAPSLRARLLTGARRSASARTASASTPSRRRPLRACRRGARTLVRPPPLPSLPPRTMLTRTRTVCSPLLAR